MLALLRLLKSLKSFKFLHEFFMVSETGLFGSFRRSRRGQKWTIQCWARWRWETVWNSLFGLRTVEV